MLSPSSARKAEKLGYTNVKIFHDGMPVWRRAGNVVEATNVFIDDMIKKDMPFILIDVRKAKRLKEGFIQGAVSLPSRIFEPSLEYLPDDKRAPIILYGDAADMRDATELAQIAISKGRYRNVSVLKGGYERFATASPHLIKTGDISPVKAKLAYIAKPRPGEVPIGEFKKIADTLPKDKLILDVRDVDEAMHGMLKGAINIPAQDIKARLAEIPKDREIIAHCVAGVRAEMAFHTLREAGYKARFLNATIKIDKDGKYEITKE
jgi:rhodanese-related sulfurtransferase